MVTTVTTPLLSAEDIVRMGSQGERMELIDGVPREKEGVSGRHGEIEVQLTIPLGSHVLENQLGRIYPSDTQFKILRDPDIIHIPDLAFVRADRLPLEAERWHIMPLAPDLAVEVVSPNDRYEEVLEKIERYHRAGVLLVWLVQPRRRAIEVHPLGQPAYLLREGDVLDGGDVVPGFRLPVADVFR
jgi:Uma2 family endonuclease